MKYLVISIVEGNNTSTYIKEFKTYEKAKPYFESQRSEMSVRYTALVDVQEEYNS
jgi:hypothetical protein